MHLKKLKHKNLQKLNEKDDEMIKSSFFIIRDYHFEFSRRKIPTDDKTGLLNNHIEQTDILEFYVYSKNSTLYLIENSIKLFL